MWALAGCETLEKASRGGETRKKLSLSTLEVLVFADLRLHSSFTVRTNYDLLREEAVNEETE